MMVAYVVNNVVYVEDRHALAKETPILDSCQDWILIAGIFSKKELADCM